MTIKDLFLLTQSKEFHIDPQEEVRVDLKLKLRPHPVNTKITGKVTHKRFPVSGATVKILDEKYNPIAHVLTNDNGYYVIENLQPGTYRLTATAIGYFTSNTIRFTLHRRDTVEIDVELKEDYVTQHTNIVYGTVTEMLTGKLITMAEIQLFSAIDKKLVAETMSNDYGQYMLCEIPAGEYFIIAHKVGYAPGSPIQFVASKGQFIQIPFLLVANEQMANGTVSGIISTDFSKPLENVTVGLFQVNDSNELLIQIKMTNREGLYLFSDVSSGYYIVKAKIQDRWEHIDTQYLP